VLEIEPELVYGNGTEENGSYRVDYDGILAITVKSLQEALARIDQLEKTIKDIERIRGKQAADDLRRRMNEQRVKKK